MQGIYVARPVALTASVGYSILNLEWCGKSLDTLSSQVLKALNPIPSCTDSLRQNLSAGVVHGDLALHNIAFRGPDFTVLDWETSNPCNENGGRRDEDKLLASFS